VMLCRAVWYKLFDVSDMLTASIIIVMMAVRTYETSVNFYHTTRRNVPEDSFILVVVRTWTITLNIRFSYYNILGICHLSHSCYTACQFHRTWLSVTSIKKFKNIGSKNSAETSE
jgi:hypothetical protein